MTAAIGHPTLRLVRARIGAFALGDLAPGKWRELTAVLMIRSTMNRLELPSELFLALRLRKWPSLRCLQAATCLLARILGEP